MHDFPMLNFVEPFVPLIKKFLELGWNEKIFFTGTEWQTGANSVFLGKNSLDGVSPDENVRKNFQNIVRTILAVHGKNLVLVPSHVVELMTKTLAEDQLSTKKNICK